MAKHESKIPGMWRRILAPGLVSGNRSDKSLLQLHRRTEVLWVLPILPLAFAVSLFTDFGRFAGASFMETVALVLPLLFLAQVVERGFVSQRVVEEDCQTDDDKVFARQYVGTSATVALVAFLAGEATALAGVSAGPTTFTVIAALAIGIWQSVDLTFSFQTRGLGGLAVGTMLDMRRRWTKSARRKQHE